eukprot:Phypoly_transcript_03958.p1 GENE.Phypoly_transcript_03958~~Phypoly_transcript_03958.p1  ORF type:complete len:766 (+),score=103.11 Phypoly_transcript_03958:320-2299(+)
MTLTEHIRAVNRVSWYPANSNLFLTGSQDGTMKLWDLRERAISKTTFNGHAESVRDVQFSPFYPDYFVAGFDNGNVQIWDIRKPNQVKDTLSAHQALVLTVDWHPEEKNIIATGGRDRMVKVWDLSSLQKTPVHSIQTISSVARVKWRPNHKYHIASCSSLLDFRIHIWDVRTPYIPIAGLVGHRDVATGLAWNSGHSLLSCSKDSSVIMHDTASAERPATTVRTAALSWSIHNELLSANDPIVRADIHDLTPDSFPPPPPPLPNLNKSKGNITTYVPQELKRLGSVFDSDLFVFFANNYKLFGAPLTDLCSHNSEIAARAQQHQIAQVWQLIKLFYDPEFDPVSEFELDSEKNAVNLSLNHSLEQDLDHSSLMTPPRRDSDAEYDALGRFALTHRNEFFEPVLTEGYDPRDAFLRSDAIQPLSPLPLHTTSFFSDSSRPHPTSPPLFSHPSPTFSYASPSFSLPPSSPLFFSPFVSSSVEMWDHTPSVVALLEYLAERGDVQSCVAICTVLGSKLEVPKEMFLQWTTNYIELLQRHKLWTIANLHIKLCPAPEIAHLNQASTTIHTGCAYCGKPLLQKGWICEKCKKVTGICSLCQQPVKGMYTWCQGCGHGGHLAHLQDWFVVQGQKLCPGGCSHACTYLFYRSNRMVKNCGWSTTL